MKKIFILLKFIFIGLIGLSYAQPAASYLFESKMATYTEISGGTTVINLLGDDIKGEVWNNSINGQKKEPNPYVKGIGFPLGFNFTFNGEIMKRFAFDSYGTLYLGKDSVESEGSRGRLAFNDIERGCLNFVGCVFHNWQDVIGLPSTQISYLVSGTSPNQILTLQYKNIGLKVTNWGENDSLNFQIKLYENESKIEIVFGDCQISKEDLDFQAAVGIKGNAEDMHIRTALTDWSNSTYSDIFVSNSESGKCCVLNDNIFPAVGLTYTFTRPSACTTPVIQPTDLVFNVSSTTLKGSFTKTNNLNHRYLVVMSPNANLSSLPTNKTIYSIGDKIGDGQVLYFGKDSIFETVLSPATTKYVHVFTTNYLCADGPSYNTSNPLSASVKALPDGPTSLTFSKTSFDSISFNVVGNANNDKILVAITDVPGSDQYNPIAEGGTFGNPNGKIYQVGDTIRGGGIVVYRGESANGVVISDLMQNTIYHLQAWSIDSRENLYSTIHATADTITLASVPYLQSLNKEPQGIPMGWSCDSTVKFVLGSDLVDGVNMLRVSTNYLKPTPQTNIYTSPWIKMSSEKENRLIFKYNMNIYESRQKKPWNKWDEKDSIMLQYSLDGINYINFAVIDYKNRDEFATASSICMRRFPIVGVKGHSAKIRIAWHNEKLTPLLSIYALEIDEIDECDYPLEISVNQASILGSSATLSWKAVEGVQLYNLRYGVAGSNQWSLIENIDKTTYTITTLPGNSKVEVSVQAKCSQENLSRFYASVNFNSGYAVPFMEKFDFSNYASNVRVLPFWEAKRGKTSDMTDTITFGTISSWAKDKWHGNSTAFDCMGVSLRNNNSHYLLAPKVNLGDGKSNYKLVFDFSIFNTDDNIAPTTMDSRSNFNVLISTDAGKTWLKKNTLFRLDSVNNSLLSAATGKTFEVDLTGYKGDIQIAFMYATYLQEPFYPYLDNIGILPTCSPITDLKASKVVSDSIYFEWKSTSTNFLTKLNNGVVSTTTEKTMKFGNLTPQTEYTFAVATVCKEGDTSFWETIKITTASVKDCEMPTDVSVSDIKKTSAKLSWTGDAQTYKIRFKSETATTWVTQIADKTSADLIALSLNTTYQYSIQSICSNAAGDTSAWTEIATFKTADISCFAPTELKTSEVKHTTASFSWTSTAGNFEFAYRLGTTGNWTNKNSTSKTISISDLTANSNYTARVRAICADDDTSAWSEVLAFETTITPICATPSNLRSQNITTNSADILWDKDDSQLKYLLRYRISTATKWDSVRDITANQYALANLVPGSAYTWTVQASCDEGRISAWGNQANFTTIDVNNDKTAAAMLEIFASKGQIHLLNKGGMNINKIDILNTLGQIVESYSVNSSDHVIITTQVKSMNVIVRVSNNHFVKSYKLMIP